jgi:hypothetical protein
MADRAVTVVVSSGDGAEVRGEGVVTELSLHARGLRAGGFLLGAVVLAASLIPVPIIHFIGPPALLISGGVMAVRQLRATARLAPLRLACPKCGAVNRIGGGIGVAHPERPIAVSCESCRRGLTVTLVARA